ncbi:MAG: hypothetical protein MHM6MM_000044 [Cercozoa sp. M6MM]
MGKHHHLEASDLLPQKGKQVLPIDAARDDIVRAVRDNNVVIVTGATGSGKSTQLPQILLQEKYSVAISQPRRIGAVSLAQRVAAEIGSDVGDTVGYCVRFDRRDENCEAVFFSDGVLIGELTQDPLLRRFDVVWIRDRLRKVEGADLDALAHLREGSVAERLLEELRLEQRRRKKEAERIDARIAALRRQSESTDQSDKQSDKQPNEADDEEEEEQAQEHRQEDLDDQAAAQLALQRYRLRKRARHEAGLSL